MRPAGASLVALEVPPLPAGAAIVDKDGLPSLAFAAYWQQTIEAIVGSVNAVLAAQAAADAANAAAAAANTAAIAAADTADAITASNALGTSFVSGCTITATDAGANVTVTISAHTRHYPQPDGSTVDVSVSGGSVTALAYTTSYFIYYDDPARAGGGVTYQATTSSTTAAQLGDRHTVGSVLTPAAAGAPTSGGTVAGPGAGTIEAP